MARPATQFEHASGGTRLSHAILLYRGTPAFASFHAIDEADGHPMIAAGTPLTRAHLRQWAEALGKASRPELLPENVLIAHADVLAWWVPEAIRPAYFALTRPPKRAKALASRTVLPVPYPAHLFVATRKGLGVYALAASARPTADTVILHSPVLNVFLGGQLCWGNVARPKSIGVAAIADFERAVFDSWSTHPNPGQELTIAGPVKDSGGLVKLWDDLAARGAKRFPVERLKPFNPDRQRKPDATPLTLAQLIAGTMP